MKVTFPDIRTVLKDGYDLLRSTMQKCLDDDIMTQGAAIAFYTIFSIAPLFVLVVAFSGFFLSEDQISRQIQEQLAAFVGDDLAASLNELFLSRTISISGFWTTILAAVTIAFGATTVISQLKSTLNSIWNVQEVKIHSIWNFFLNRLLAFGMILIFSLLLLASLLAEAIIGIATTFLADHILMTDIDYYALISQTTTVLLSVAFFTLIFKILPDVHARWTDVFVGAVVTTVLFLLGKNLIGYYMSASGLDATYRAAGALVVFVVWVYYNVIIVLLGAVFTQIYTSMFGGRILPYRFVTLKAVGNTREKRDPQKSGPD
ncbi:MAG: YihY/virulence factor BrkB family protein [Balneolaceae bacterium]